jgi:transposase
MPLRLRSSINRRNGKEYRYYQLVRAVRREGKPTHQVVAHVGRLAEHEAAAIRQGLATGRLREENADGRELRVKVTELCAVAALRYLDVRVVCSLWEQWGLSEFFSQHLVTGKAEMPAADVVLVLVTNRCLDPCSKLRVTEWAPRTVLPELLHFQPSQLNNTRIHRVLEELEGIEDALTPFLIKHPRRCERADSVIYLDLTNTWFAGHGGELGQRTRSKDGGGIRQHVVQLAMAVDADGFPLRWEVLPGKTAEATVLPRWIDALGQFPELASLPLSFDRGLCSEDNLVTLLAAHRSFVTCRRQSDIEKWGLAIDLEAIHATPEGELPRRETLEKAGLHSTEDEDIFHVDCGNRAPLGMDSIPKPGLRVVPYFRPSLFRRNRDSLVRLRKNVLGKVAAFNAELRQARRSRSEAKTREKVEKLLKHFELEDEFAIRLEPHAVAGKSKTLQSYQVRLDRIETPSSRLLNAGWMVLLAHPEDRRSPLELIRQYHKKEVIEHAFGLIKSFVELRPIRHQTNQKIKAHVTLCMLGLLLDRWLELTLREAGVRDAVDRVYQALEPCRLHALSERGRRHFRLGETTPEQRRLLRALRLSEHAAQEAADALSRRRY